MAVAVDGCGTRFKVVFIGLSLDMRGKKESRAPTNRRRDSEPHALPVHPWSEQHGPLRGRLGSAQILSGRLAGPAH